MEPVLKPHLELLELLHQDCQIQISGLTQEELDWRPGHDMNSLAVLAAHVAGAERYWVGDVIMGEVSGRDRSAEFTTSAVSGEILSHRLASAFDYSRKALQDLTAGQLVEVRTSPRDGRKFTVA